MRSRRDAARDLDVKSRFAVSQLGFSEQPVRDRIQDFRPHEIRRRDSQRREPGCESGEVTIGLEDTAVHDSPDFIDSIPKYKAAILDGDGRRTSRKELAVQKCEQAALVRVGLKLIRELDVRTGTAGRWERHC